MGIPILSVRDDQGNIIPIPAIQGEAGPPGQKGDTGLLERKADKGDTGDPGPNLINQNTLTPMAGILMGSGGSVKTAVSGTDYATPAEVAAKLDADDYTRTINTATTTGTASKLYFNPGSGSRRAGTRHDAAGQFPCGQRRHRDPAAAKCQRLRRQVSDAGRGRQRPPV